MKEEFNLSKTNDTLLNKRIYTEENVKEFIRRLKEDMPLEIPDEIMDKIIKLINKLAGKELEEK